MVYCLQRIKGKRLWALRWFLWFALVEASLQSNRTITQCANNRASERDNLCFWTQILNDFQHPQRQRTQIRWAVKDVSEELWFWTQSGLSRDGEGRFGKSLENASQTFAILKDYITKHGCQLTDRIFPSTKVASHAWMRIRNRLA